MCHLSYNNMPKVKEHIDLSKHIIRCKKCKCLTLIKYLDNTLCEKCDKEYNSMLNKIK